MRTRAAVAPLLIGIAVLAAGCATWKEARPLHPAGDGKPPMCSGCHDESRASMDHVPDYGRAHRFAAAPTSRDTCLLCHRESSCAVCHANSTGMTPADTLRRRPDREAPHRGDWLTRHRVEAKVNPVSCATCHARRDNGRCRPCHR